MTRKKAHFVCEDYSRRHVQHCMLSESLGKRLHPFGHASSMTTFHILDIVQVIMSVSLPEASDVVDGLCKG